MFLDLYCILFEIKDFARLTSVPSAVDMTVFSKGHI